MNSKISAAWLVVVGALFSGSAAQARERTQYEALVATHARANGVPEALVHRVIVRESKYQPALVGRGGTIGLMQIKLATARGLGYTGTAEGLRDPETNLTYGVKYLAGAYRAANSDHNRAMHYYASGYYYAAKRLRLEHVRHPEFALVSGPPNEAGPEAAANPDEAARPDASVETPKQTLKPRVVSKSASRKLADAKLQVPHLPLDITSGAHAAKPR
jgi:hypothetical protein